MTASQFLKYHGGKFYLKDWIRFYLPKHELYVEPFLGGGAVLQTVRGPRVGADVNSKLINLWIQLRDSDEFVSQVQDIKYSKLVWDYWNDWKSHEPMMDPLDQAIQYLIRLRFSRGGLGTAFAWSERSRGGQPGDVNAWVNFKKSLPQIQRSILGVSFRLASFEQTLREYDSPTTCFYCDPPYLHNVRTATKAYDYEMTYSQHTDLCNMLLDIKGTAVVSGYANELYDTKFSSWARHVRNMPNNAGQGSEKARREEVLWIKE